MNVLHLIAPGPIAGAERVVLGGARALKEAGVRAHVGVLGDRRHPDLERGFVAAASKLQLGVGCVEVFRTRGRVDMSAVRRLRGALRGQAFDVLHVHGYKALAYGVLARHRGQTTVATHHGESASDSKVRAYESVAAMSYRRVDRVVAVSDAVRDLLLARGVARGRIRTIENFLTLSALPFEPPPSAPGLELLFVGRLAPEKGLDVLLDALERGEARGHLTVVGDGAERSALEQRAHRLGLDERVHFVGWQDDVTPFLRRASAVVMPSLREGLPLAAIEAAALGRPLVASAVGGIPGLVDDGRTALLVPPGDAAALAAALATLAERLETLQAAAIEASASIRERYSPERWARETVADYRAVLEAA